jgi:hypothetical protein
MKLLLRLLPQIQASHSSTPEARSLRHTQTLSAMLCALATVTIIVDLGTDSLITPGPTHP